MSSEEDEGPSRGKGYPRGKRGDKKGGNRGNRSNRGGRGNKHHKGGDYNRYGGNSRYNGDKNRQYENDYNPNFDRSRRQYDDEDYEEDIKEKSYDNYNDNDYDNDNDNDDYYYGNSKHRNKNKNSQNNSNYHNEENKNYKEEHKNKNKSVIHKEKKNFLSFKKLKELSAKEETNDIIEYFHNNDEIFDEIKKKKFEKEACYLLMNIIERMSEVNSEPVLIVINKIIDNTRFIQENIADFLNEKAFEKEAYLNFLYDVIKFLNKCLLINTNSKKIDINLNEHKRTLELIKSRFDENIKNKRDSIIQEINDYEKKKVLINLEEFEKNMKKREEDELKNKKINDKSYNDMEIIINTKDFAKNIKYNLDPNITKGSYESYEHYINTMFFLEYEDCYRSLRRAIFNLIQDGKSLNQLDKQEKWTFERRKHDIYCYLEGEIIKAEMNHDGILITIDFVPLVGKKIKFTKRMINGSLVIITNNEFKDYLLTTVAYNPYIEKKILENSKDKKRLNKLKLFNIPKEPKYRIKLELINISPESFKFLIQNRTNLQLFESRAYFQSYVHVLHRLQNMVIKELPFENEIIKADFNNLLINNERKEFKYGNDIIRPYEDKYPLFLESKLDDSQLKAIKHCLTSKIALIQGPPGTGKTHVGSIITNILIQNLKKNSKILVVCFTNHALDQFLESILKENHIEDSIVRIGGRCKNEIVKKLVLNSEKYKSFQYRDCEMKLNQIGHQMADVMKLIDTTKKLIIDEVKEDFPEIYKKVVDDFFKILKIKKEDYIPKFPLDRSTNNKYKNNKKELLRIKEDIIGNKIFNFWCYTGQKDYKISDLISNIFDEMELDNYNQIIDASVNFKDYENDNNKLINILKNYKKTPIKSNINQFKEKVSNDYEYNEDDSDEDDEISCGCSLDEYDERTDDNNDFKEEKLEDDIDLFKNTRISYDGLCQNKKNR